MLYCVLYTRDLYIDSAQHSTAQRESNECVVWCSAAPVYTRCGGYILCFVYNIIFFRNTCVYNITFFSFFYFSFSFPSHLFSLFYIWIIIFFILYYIIHIFIYSFLSGWCAVLTMCCLKSITREMKNIPEN